jgi:hypothetical protein
MWQQQARGKEIKMVTVVEAPKLLKQSIITVNAS